MTQHDTPTGRPTARTHATSRRTFLRAAGTAAVLGLAGCTRIGSGRPDGVHLDPPENYEQLEDAELPYPIYGEKLPDATLPSPTLDRDLRVREFVGDRVTFLTFVYTRCGGICPAEISNFVQVQARAAERGWSGDVALEAITFDPTYDTPERLDSFGADLGARYDQGNWFWLRPTSHERAKAVVQERYGEAFERNDGDGMPWLHRGLILLANEDGYVERAYSGKPPQPARMVADFEALMEA